MNITTVGDHLIKSANWAIRISGQVKAAKGVPEHVKQLASCCCLYDHSERRTMHEG